MMGVAVWVACSPSPPLEPVSSETGGADTGALVPAGRLDLVAAPVAGRSDAVDITVTAIPDAPAAVACEGGGERHMLDLVGTGVARVAGLLADTEYRCEASAGPLRSLPVTVRTQPLPPGLPSWTVTGTTDGYTLFNTFELGAPGRSQRVVIVDPQGRVRWTADGPEDVLADLDVSLVDSQTLLVAGASGHPPTLQTLDGEVLWQAGGPEGEGWYHHDARSLPTGEVLALATDRTDDGAGGSWWGFAVERLDPGAAAPRWLWRSQQAVDAGGLPVPSGSSDPWHANAVTLQDDQLWVSLAFLDRVLRIDTVSGEVSGVLGRGGNWSLLGMDGTPLGDADWFRGQHDPEWSGDRVLIYDNKGGGSPGAPSSRVVELELDDLAGTARVVWEWTEPGWYEPLFGDADRLGEDRVRITMGHCHGCEPTVDASRRSAIVEVDRASGAVLWRLELDGPRDGVYRSEHVDGCALFVTNQAMCP